MTHLLDAIRENNVQDVLKGLTDRDVLSHADEAGWTPIFAAVALGNYEIVIKLIEAGADYSKIDNQGLTPKDYAILRDDNHMVEILEKTASNDERLF